MATLVSSEARTTTLLTPSEAATMIGVTSRTIRRWTAQGHLPCLRINRTTRYRAADLVALIGRDLDPLPSRDPDGRARR